VPKLKIGFVLVLAVAALAACGLFGHNSGRSSDEEIQKILDGTASFVVFLSYDTTEAQRTDVEAALRALPEVTGVTFVDHDAAYRRMKQLYSAEPSEMPQIKAEDLPESFEVTMTNFAAVRKIRDSNTTVAKLPGVQRVIYPCTTVPECRTKFANHPVTLPS
jgi:cell division transport system permease protein